MALDTYANLQTSIGDWLNRSDLSAIIPDLITLAETKMFSRLRLRGMESRQTATLGTTNQYLALPTGFISMRTLRLTSTTPYQEIRYVTPEQITAYYKDGSDRPKWYTIFGSELQFEVVPDSAYTIEMTLYAAPTRLSGSNSTNTILTSYPNIYLFGALAQAEPYLQNDDRVQLWEAKFNQEIDEANLNDKNGRYSGSALVIRNDTYNP